MRATQRHPRAVRRGFTVIEVSLALAVLLAASVLLTQFLVASSQQRKLADQRRLALEELSNRLERVMAAKWEDVTVAAIEGQELSQAVQENLPAAKLTADIADELGGSTSGKRVRLEISWEQHGQRVSPNRVDRLEISPAGGSAMKSKANSRRGWSLLEMLVVIPLTAILLSTSGVLLTALLRSQGLLSADIRQQSARARLATQLRTDAHEASSAKSPSPKVCDFLRESGETVHYEIKDSSLHRELRQSDTILEREKYPLAGLSATFAVDDSPQRPLVRLTLESVPEGAQYSWPARPSTLEAAVGICSPLAEARPEP